MTAALAPNPSFPATDFSPFVVTGSTGAASPQARPVPSVETYRRRRLVALAIIGGLLLGVLSFMQQADAVPTPEGQLAESVTVIVQPGDTLWDIAVAAGSSGDPRGLVDRLVDLAGTTDIQPGQRLVMPAHWLS